MKPRKIYLTGCTGEIGSRLTPLLLHLGHEVIGVRNSKECSVEDPKHICNQINLLNSTENLGMYEIRPDVLVHTAWLTTPIEFWESGQNAEWIEASKRIIKEFHLSGGKYLVVTGSCAEYSWAGDIPLDENSLELPASAYGKAKLDLLNWIKEQEIPFLWTRTFFQFGMNEPKGRLIPGIIDSVSSGKEFIIKNGSDIRDFVYVEDIARILTLLISQEETGLVNIGTGQQTEVSAIVKIITKLIDQPNLLESRENKGKISLVVADPKKLYSMIGEFQWTSLETALMASIEARKHPTPNSKVREQ